MSRNRVSGVCDVAWLLSGGDSRPWFSGCGNDFQIGEVSGGQTASQLGIRRFTENTKLSALNYGVGVPNRIDRTLSITFTDISITSSDGQIFAVNLSAAATLTDAINAINAVTTVNVTAQLDQDGAGIELIDNTAGVDALSVTQSGSSLPITGGIDLTLPSDDFTITASDGQTFRIDLSDAISVGDVIDLINTAAAGVVTIQLTDTGNGLELIDQTVGIGSLTITQSGGSQAAEYLGFLHPGGQPIRQAH